MLRRTANNLVRMPRIHRPQHRFYEIFHQKSVFGLKTASLHWGQYFFFWFMFMGYVGNEVYYQYYKYLVRGSECEQCRNERYHYHHKLKETAESYQLDKQIPKM